MDSLEVVNNAKSYGIDSCPQFKQEGYEVERALFRETSGG